eukprot:TRINITY_DN6551_c0_g1_i1.p1 TRINITY_DN6551_c0_g1~~TRINITY_DN6551_c0_g1_i1.p1  ORF type:complete len:151 (+),score=5.18 TRINITY_DN6551_c0_g1_i1:50-502(+)
MDSLRSDIVPMAELVTDSTEELSDVTRDVSESAEPFLVFMEDADEVRNSAVVMVLVLPLICFLVAFIGWRYQKAWLFRCNSIIAALALCLVWLTFGLHLLVIITVGDTCNYVDEMEATLRDYLNGDQIEKSCKYSTGNLHMNFRRSLRRV